MHWESAQQPARRKSDSRVAGSGDVVDTELVLLQELVQRRHILWVSVEYF